MPWQLLEGSSDSDVQLFSFEFDSAGYKLLLTDLIDVWAEEVSAESLRQRAKAAKLIVQTRTDAQMEAFLVKLRDLLANIDPKEIGKHCTKLKVEYEIPQVGKVSWDFVLKKFDTEVARETIKQVVINLFRVVGEMDLLNHQANDMLRKKSFHIRSLSDAVSRGADYAPRRYAAAYTESFNTASEESKEPDCAPGSNLKSFVTTASKHWPSTVAKSPNSELHYIKPQSTTLPDSTGTGQDDVKLMMSSQLDSDEPTATQVDSDVHTPVGSLTQADPASSPLAQSPSKRKYASIIPRRTRDQYSQMSPSKRSRR